MAEIYFDHWNAPFLAFVIFGLFGVTGEARTSYWPIIRTVCGWFGYEPKPRASKGHAPLGGAQSRWRSPRDRTSFNLDVECVVSQPYGQHLPQENRSQLSFVNPRPGSEHVAEGEIDRAGHDVASSLDKDAIEEVRRSSGVNAE